MISKKKALAAGLLCAIASVGFVADVQADEMMKHDMNEVVIEGEQDLLPGGLVKSVSPTGFLGEKDIMEIPFTITSLSQKSIDLFSNPTNGVTSALTLAPSIRSNTGGTYTDISIRGIRQTAHAFYVNGVPGLLCQEHLEAPWMAGATVIAGPNIGINGTSLSEAQSGTVNIRSKVASAAGDAKVKVNYRGGSALEETIDLGRRFGDENQYGIRINAQNINGDTGIGEEHLERQAISINFDHIGDNSKTNVLVGYDDTDHSGVNSAFSMGSDVTKLPTVPNAKDAFKPDWSYNAYDNWFVAINHEQKLSDHATAFVNAGYHREDWYGYIDGSAKIINDKGDFTISMDNYPLQLTKKYLGIGVKGDFKIGTVENEYLIGGDRTWDNYDISMNKDFADKGSWNGTGNIYEDNHWPSLERPHYNPTHNSDTRMNGWHIVDTMKALDDKLQITLGVHGHEVTKTMASTHVKEVSDAVCPTYAVSYQINPDVMVYAGHSESFGGGKLVNSSYENAGEMLDPAKTKQNEIGVRFNTGDIVNTISAFKIEQANNLDFFDKEGKKWLVQDGEKENKGFEWAFNGSLTDKWDIIGGIMYLDSKQTKTQGGLHDGEKINGAADWSGTLGAIYRPDEDWSVIGRLTYLDSTEVYDGKFQIPSYTIFDLGVNFKTQLHNTPVTFNAMCYNLFGKDYWHANPGSSSLAVGNPRTFVLSAEFDI